MEGLTVECSAHPLVAWDVLCWAGDWQAEAELGEDLFWLHCIGSCAVGANLEHWIAASKGV